MSLHIPTDMIDQVRERARGVCEYCLLPQASQEATYHVDHIRPRAKGGETAGDNLALACVTCSLKKAEEELLDRWTTFAVFSGGSWHVAAITAQRAKIPGSIPGVESDKEIRTRLDC